MSLEAMQQALSESGVCRKGHFVGVSGKHLDLFIDFEGMFKPENEGHLNIVIDGFVELVYENTILWPTVITGPANGGNLLCERLGPVLSERLGYTVKVALTEKMRDAKDFVFKERLDLAGQTVLVFDDVSTSGLSTVNMANRVRAFGGEVLGIVVAADREGLTSQKLGVPLYRYLIALKTKSCDVPNGQPCEWCLARVDFTLGVNSHTDDFVRKYGQPSTWSEERMEAVRSGHFA